MILKRLEQSCLSLEVYADAAFSTSQGMQQDQMEVQALHSQHARQMGVRCPAVRVKALCETEL